MPEDSAIDKLAQLAAARADTKEAYDKQTRLLRNAVLNALKAGHSEVQVARVAGVDRMTVRKWAGKRRPPNSEGNTMRFEMRPNGDGGLAILLDGVDVAEYVRRDGVRIQVGQGQHGSLAFVTLELQPTADFDVNVDALIEVAKP